MGSGGGRRGWRVEGRGWSGWDGCGGGERVVEGGGQDTRVMVVTHS